MGRPPFVSCQWHDRILPRTLRPSRSLLSRPPDRLPAPFRMQNRQATMSPERWMPEAMLRPCRPWSRERLNMDAEYERS